MSNKRREEKGKKEVKKKIKKRKFKSDYKNINKIQIDNNKQIIT